MIPWRPYEVQQKPRPLFSSHKSSTATATLLPATATVLCPAVLCACTAYSSTAACTMKRFQNPITKFSILKLDYLNLHLIILNCQEFLQPTVALKSIHPSHEYGERDLRECSKNQHSALVVWRLLTFNMHVS